jgi:hypothetical protein
MENTKPPINKQPNQQQQQPPISSSMNYTLPPLKTNSSLNKSHSALFQAFLSDKTSRQQGGGGVVKDKLAAVAGDKQTLFTLADSFVEDTVKKKKRPSLKAKISVQKIDMRFIT